MYWFKNIQNKVIFCLVVCLFFSQFGDKFLCSYDYQALSWRFENITWWRHQMETFSALLALCEGKSPVNSPRKGQWRGALMFPLICARINGWANNREAGDLTRHRAHYDVTVMRIQQEQQWCTQVLSRMMLDKCKIGFPVTAQLDCLVCIPLGNWKTYLKCYTPFQLICDSALYSCMWDDM